MARFSDTGARLSFADPLPTEDLPNVEILATGTWTTMSGTKVTISHSDLRELADTFNELRDRVKPFLKLGHEEDGKQTLLTGAPALGWMENVRVVGDKLVTDFLKVPQKAFQLIKAGAYRRISAEIARDWTDPATGKVHGMVLKAAGLLGATAPAINTLRDVMSLYGLKPDGELITAKVYAFADLQEGDDMDPKELKAAIDAAVSEALAKQTDAFSETIRKTLGIDEKTDPIDAIKDLKKKARDSAEVLADAENAKFSAEVDEIVLKAKKDGKLLPAGESAVRLMVKGWQREAEANDGTLEFAVQDPKTKKERKVRGTVTECLRDYFSALSPVLAIGQEFGSGRVTKEQVVAGMPRDLVEFATSGHKPTAFDAASLDRDARVKAYMHEHKETDYAKAFFAVNHIETANE